MESFKYVLYLFSCASKGEKVEIIKDIDIKEIYNISINHGIWNIVFLTIKQLYKNQKTIFNLNEELFNQYDFSFMQSLSKNVVKWNRLPEVFKKITSSGIDVCLLKGLTLGTLYNEPYSRSTTDIDLLIHPENEKEVCEILESQGFNVMYRWEGSHHTKCTRADIGLLEIHTQLYDKEVQKLWFGMNEIQNYNYDEFEFDNLTCKQLNSTDGLIFNFLHFVKHYIAGLVTVKQLMDIMLYIKKNKSDIDFEKFNKVIISLNYFKLYKTFKCFAVKYLGFTFDELEEDSSLLDYSDNVDLILEDMNNYAASTKGSIYHIYTKSLEKKKEKKSSEKKDFRRKIKGICYLLWSDKKRMIDLYGDVYEKIYLKPLLQMHRIFSRIVNIKKYINKKSAKEKNEMMEAKDRVVLFEKLDVI